MTEVIDVQKASGSQKKKQRSCVHEKRELRTMRFKNGTLHSSLRCVACGRNKFVPWTQPGQRPNRLEKTLIYTYEENLRWWNGLSKQAQSELLDKILEKANSPGVKKWAESLVELWERGSTLTEKNLASLRKWDR